MLREPRAQAAPVNAGSNRKYVIAFAGLVFLGLCGLIALRSCLRETVRSITEVDRKVDAKLLGAVAHKDKLIGSKGGTLITDPAVNPQYAQDLRRLAARISNEMSRKGRKVLLVAGAGKDESKEYYTLLLDCPERDLHLSAEICVTWEIHGLLRKRHYSLIRSEKLAADHPLLIADALLYLYDLAQ